MQVPKNVGWQKFKKISNLAWGSLCATNVQTFQYDIKKELNVNIDLNPDKVVILNQFFVRDNIFKIEYCKKSKEILWIKR